MNILHFVRELLAASGLVYAAAIGIAVVLAIRAARRPQTDEDHALAENRAIVLGVYSRFQH